MLGTEGTYNLTLKALLQAVLLSETLDSFCVKLKYLLL